MSEELHEVWHYASSQGERFGPVSIRRLSELAAQGIIGPATLVWSPGYPNWIRAEEIADRLTKAKVADVPGSDESLPDSSSPNNTMAVSASPESSSPPPEPTPPSQPDQEIKPAKIAFVGSRIVAALVLSIILATVTSIILVIAQQSPLPALAVFALVSLLGIIASRVAYHKESYQIQDTRIICRGSGLASDRTTEFEIRNITHVKLKLPWLRFKLFGVGDVIVQTAGDAKPVVMRAIHDAEAVYDGLWERMKRNGYDLSRSQLLHEERPAAIGILSEFIRLLSSLFFSLVFIVMFLNAMVLEFLKENRIQYSPYFVPALVVLFSIFALVFIIFRYLDYRRRVYRVYNDVVVYKEGFLTRHDAFIPYENISDANTRCTFSDRILGLYDVQISCQGVGAEITFRRLRHGITLSDAIDRVVVSARQKQKPATRPHEGSPNSESTRPLRRKETNAIPAGEIMVGDFRMSAARTMVPLLLLLPLFPIWVIAMIQTGIRLASTTYSVRLGSLRHSTRLVSVHDREFAFEKITGVVIKRDLWDHMLGTMTLRFWSIGSGQPLEFAHIHRSALDLPGLLRQVGIPESSVNPKEIVAAFGLLPWLRAHLNKIPWLLMLAAGIVVVAVRAEPRAYYLLALPALVAVAGLIRGMLYYPRQHLRFHADHLEAEQGILIKRRYLARYRNIKRTETVRYPGGEIGSLKIFVAGEEEVQTNLQKQQNKPTLLKQCSFTTAFLPAVTDNALLLDDILCGRVDPTANAVAAEPLEIFLEARRSVGNALFGLLLLSTVLFPMLALLPITIPSTVIRTKRWRYRIDAARVTVSHGLMYRKETSILLDRIDSLQQKQGPINKLFGNGNVSILTAGSSSPDVTLQNSPDYLKIHEVLRERSR